MFDLCHTNFPANSPICNVARKLQDDLDHEFQKYASKKNSTASSKRLTMMTSNKDGRKQQKTPTLTQ
eukprot:Awhi_evm1s10963